MIREYKKKEMIVSAILWDGTAACRSRILKFSNGKMRGSDSVIAIETLEGVMTASVGDYIVKGVTGECYPLKPYIFNLYYEPVE